MNGYRSNTIWGSLFVILGVVMLLSVLDIVSIQARYIVPALLVAIGIAVIMGGARAERQR